MNSNEVKVLQQFCIIKKKKSVFLCYLLLEKLITLTSEFAKKCFESSIQELEILKKKLFFLS